LPKSEVATQHRLSVFRKQMDAIHFPVHFLPLAFFVGAPLPVRPNARRLDKPILPFAISKKGRRFKAAFPPLVPLNGRPFDPTRTFARHHAAVGIQFPKP